MTKRSQPGVGRSHACLYSPPDPTLALWIRAKVSGSMCRMLRAWLLPGSTFAQTMICCTCSRLWVRATDSSAELVVIEEGLGCKALLAAFRSCGQADRVNLRHAVCRSRG